MLMKTLEKGKEKLKYICDVLRNETLEPAQKDAEAIIAKAKKEREAILSEAEKNADRLVEAARECIAKERSVFEASLSQASQQCLEALRQEIEQKLFNTELSSLITKNTADATIIAQALTAIIKAIEKEGSEADLSAVIAASVSKDAVNSLLCDEILNTLRSKSVSIGDFAGGAQLKVHDKKITIDLSNKALEELFSTYIRKDFRRFLFKK
jgi:V/A-type H+/Na+-transporting ATPase subunit E